MTTRREILKAAATAPAIAVASAAPVLGSGTAAQARRETIGAPGPGGLPFSAAVRYGDLLFVSGNVGNNPGTLDLVPGGTTAQTRQALENIKATLELAGSSMADVLKATVFLADIDDYAAMNDVYRTYFPDDPPARSTLAASGLAIGALVEIEVIDAAR